MALFLGIVLSVWSAFHVYALQRAFSIPAISRAVPFAGRVALFALLWLSYPVGRVLAHKAPGAVARAVEAAGATWMGVLFLAVTALLAADLLTGFGKLCRAERSRRAPRRSASPRSSRSSRSSRRRAARASSGTR